MNCLNSILSFAGNRPHFSTLSSSTLCITLTNEHMAPLLTSKNYTTACHRWVAGKMLQNSAALSYAQRHIVVQINLQADVIQCTPHTIRYFHLLKLDLPRAWSNTIVIVKTQLCFETLWPCFTIQHRLSRGQRLYCLICPESREEISYLEVLPSTRTHSVFRRATSYTCSFDTDNWVCAVIMYCLIIH